MRQLLLVLFLIVSAALDVAAQVTTSLPPTQLTAYRPVGEKRLWTFVVHDSAVGRLISTTTGPATIEGMSGSGINELLSLDYTKAGSKLVM